MARRWVCTDGFSEENLLTHLVQGSHIGVGVIDGDWRYQAVNEKLAAMNGMPAEEHLGKTVREVLGLEVALQVETLFRKVFDTGSPVLNYEIYATLATQRRRAAVSLFPISDTNGRITQLGALVMDLPVERVSVDSSPVLRSWKEIAKYLGTCVRTVQRWERLHGFPVRRVERDEWSRSVCHSSGC